jgi:hypothetical protein
VVCVIAWESRRTAASTISAGIGTSGERSAAGIVGMA